MNIRDKCLNCDLHKDTGELPPCQGLAYSRLFFLQYFGSSYFVLQGQYKYTNIVLEFLKNNYAALHLF
jgi:hypothetical protein